MSIFDFNKLAIDNSDYVINLMSRDRKRIYQVALQNNLFNLTSDDGKEEEEKRTKLFA